MCVSWSPCVVVTTSGRRKEAALVVTEMLDNEQREMIKRIGQVGVCDENIVNHDFLT